MKRIFVIGSSNTDLVVKCPKLPKPGETILGGDMIQANGGKGANQAVAAARLGGNVVFLCKTGDDAFGRDNINAYTREGIDVQYIVTDTSAPSGAALILVDSAGENTIAVAPGANSRLAPSDVDPLRHALQDGDIMLLQLEIPMDTVIHAARIGRERGAVVILDPAPAPVGGLADALLRSLDYITPNQHEADALASACGGCGADAMLQRGVKNVIITKDKEGCLLISNDGSRSFPAYPVQAVDSTAAGDAFAGALAVGLADGYNLENAVSWAQQAAALSVTRMGAQPSLPTRKELLAYNF